MFCQNPDFTSSQSKSKRIKGTFKHNRLHINESGTVIRQASCFAGRGATASTTWTKCVCVWVCVCCCLANICRGLAERHSLGCSSWITVRKSKRQEGDSVSQSMGQVRTHALTDPAVSQGLIYTGTLLKDTSAGRTLRSVEETGWTLRQVAQYAFFLGNFMTDLHD